MARDTQVDRALQVWAEWLQVGDGSGYPTKSVLHPQWSPPSPGVLPSLKVGAPSVASVVHLAVRRLSLRLANTLVMHYVLRPPIAEQAERLGCQVNTLYARVEQAHRELQPFIGVGGGFTD